MSRTVFADKFMKLVGKSPIRYLSEWRMIEAAELLRTTDLSMSKVAESVGYNSEISFRKAFRNLTGYPPGMIRR